MTWNALGLFAAGTCVIAFAQTPVIYTGGAVNAAGLIPASQPGHGLAPGSIASLFGENLASTTLSASNFPLPKTLGGTSVIVNGNAVPLFYVSPGQINFQVPSDAPWSYTAYGQISIQVMTAAGSSNTIVADGVQINQMAFSLNASGCGPGAVLNVSADGHRSLNSSSNSAAPGEYIEVYGTGLGQVYNPPLDGTPASSNPLSTAMYGGGIVFDSLVEANATFSGRAPGLVGVDQMNVQIPSNVRQGCAVPIGRVTMSIHTGGGECVDPPIQGTGSFLLERSVVMNDSTIPETDTLSGSFSASPGKTLPPQPPPVPYGIGNWIQAPMTPACPIPGYSAPDAGLVSLSGSNLPAAVQIAPTASANGIAYQETLPAGSVAAGAYQLSAAGGNGIGKFQTPITVGPGIQVTSQFPPGQLGGGTLAVNWTGGQTGELVTVKVVQHEFFYNLVNLVVVPATAQTASFDPAIYYFLNGVDTEIDVQVGPDPTQITTFTAPGLTLGGQASWLLEYRFVNLSF